MAKPKIIADKKQSAATVLGIEASLAGAKPSTKSLKRGKLPPKNKSRLPRRQKKAQQKAAWRLGSISCLDGSERESDGTRAGVRFVKTVVSVNWRVETQRLEQDSGLAGLYGLPAGD